MSRRIAVGSLIAAMAVLLVWSALDARAVARIAGEQEVVARRAQQQATAAASELAATRDALREAQLEVGRLQRELDGALTYTHSLGEVLARQSEAQEQSEVARAAAAAITSVPPPAGVQRCLATLRACLQADGFEGMRLLRASALRDATLFDVEALDLGGAGTDGGKADAGIASSGAGELLVAARMTATLDRALGEIVLTFLDGCRQVRGVRTAFPDQGWTMRLRPVEGRMWEERLPYLVRAAGAYPEDRAPALRRGSSLDPVTRAQWLERFDLLLDGAGTDLALQVTGITDLDHGVFRSARVTGYERGRMLALAADCEQLAVEVDERAAIVSLLLRNGTLRRQGVESSIGDDGYRMLLPNVTPRLASERMLGMVIRR